MLFFAMNYWLMKTEPEVFGIEDLKKKKREPWTGVRGFAARNHMRAMKLGDRVLFYHSSAKPSGVAGLAKVVKEAYPDHTSWDPKSEYFDKKSTEEKPLWFMVDVGYESTFKNYLSLDSLKKEKPLKNMILFKEGRLSVQPVSKEEFDWLCKLGTA